MLALWAIAAIRGQRAYPFPPFSKRLRACSQRASFAFWLLFPHARQGTAA